MIRAGEMYVYAGSDGKIWMDCPDLKCTEPIVTVYTPTMARLNELAQEHAYYHRLIEPTTQGT